MNRHPPRIEVRAKNGYVVLREGLGVCFYMRAAHSAVKHAVLQSLDTYLDAVGGDALGLYADEDGEWQALDLAGWERTRWELSTRRGPVLLLRDAKEGSAEYQFAYHGKPLDDPSWGRKDDPGPVCGVQFWLPTEFLAEHGPERVRDLFLRMAAPLPFNSGHAGLSFIGELDLLGVPDHIDQHRFRHPGLDIPKVGWHSLKLGTRVRGAYWMTFLGQPVLGALGGVAGLRSRLKSPETTVQELDGDRAVVTLGPGPEAGDTEQGQTLPAYRELARVLEPWTYFEEHLRNDVETRRRWERRFLDE